MVLLRDEEVLEKAGVLGYFAPQFWPLLGDMVSGIIFYGKWPLCCLVSIKNIRRLPVELSLRSCLRAHYRHFAVLLALSCSPNLRFYASFDAHFAHNFVLNSGFSKVHVARLLVRELVALVVELHGVPVRRTLVDVHLGGEGMPCFCSLRDKFLVPLF